MDRRAERPLNTALGWRLPGWLLDAAPAGFIFVVGAAAVGADPRARDATKGALLLGLVVAAAVLLVRHRAPLIVLGITLVLYVTLGWAPVVILPVLLALFTVAEDCDRRHLVGSTIVAAAVLIATDAVHHAQITIAGVISRLVVIGLAVAVGLYLRARADYITGLRDRAERLERERELLAQQAVGDERVRLARELHDAVAHNVSLMVVQAQAIAVTNGGSEHAAALGQIADTGRDALSEMHRMLGVLRVQNGVDAEREPAPGVRDLEALIHRTRNAGLEVSLAVEGASRQLPTTIDLSVYRIIQEALTNVIRHAGAEHVTVTLTYSPEALEVTVLDDGTSYTPPGLEDDPAGGNGLVGMRERVALFGGDLETGPRRYGEGYRVRALLPLS